MTKLGYTLLYVADVKKSVEFWERAFGLEQQVRRRDPNTYRGAADGRRRGARLRCAKLHSRDIAGRIPAAAERRGAAAVRGRAGDRRRHGGARARGQGRRAQGDGADEEAVGTNGGLRARLRRQPRRAVHADGLRALASSATSATSARYLCCAASQVQTRSPKPASVVGQWPPGNSHCCTRQPVRRRRNGRRVPTRRARPWPRETSPAWAGRRRACRPRPAPSRRPCRGRRAPPPAMTARTSPAHRRRC